MRILNIEGTYFVKELKNRGHEVLSIGSDDQCDIKLEKTLSFKELLSLLKSKNFFPEVVLWNDVCKLPTVFGFETLPCLTIGFTIDQYCNPWHIPFFSAFDVVLVAQKDYMKLFYKDYRPQKIFWFPLFAQPIDYFIDYSKRKIDISFVGTINGNYNKNRKKFLENFSKFMPLVVRQGDYKSIYANSKIVLNQSAAGEVNFRIFEALSCGTVVLTENIANGLTELFEPEKEILIYKRNNYLEAVNIAKKWINSPQLEVMALTGYEKIKKYHSVEVRTDKLLKIAHKFLVKKFYQWRINNIKTILNDISKALFFISEDEILPVSSEIRFHFREIGKRYLKLVVG